MLTIRTEYVTSVSGKGQIKATGHGRQRTISYAHSQSVEVNHAKACGTLVNLLTDERQQSMIRHPSGARRVHHSVTDDGRFHNWYVDV